MIAFMVVEFAGAVTAEQRHGLPLPDRQAHAEQNLAGAVIDVEILDLHDRLRTHIAAPAWCSVPR